LSPPVSGAILIPLGPDAKLGANGLKFDDLMAMCLRRVVRNRRRYKAVLASIAFGTAGFIIIQTMGYSVEKKMGEQLELLGEATVMRAEFKNESNVHPNEFTGADVSNLKKIRNVMAVAPVVSLRKIDVYFQTTQWMPTLLGIDNEYWLTQTCRIQNGRLIGPSDVQARKKVVVLGEDAVKYLFKNADPVGQEALMDNLAFTVIGTLGGVQNGDTKSGVIIPITTAQSLFPGLSAINDIYIRASNWDEVESVREQALDVLKKGHKGYESGIRVIHYPERIEKVKSTVYRVKLFIWTVLSVAVVLGGLGITNIMLSAVQARTREIGLRKAIGAREEFILIQFLTESGLIGLFAGSIGVAAGILLVLLLKHVLGVDVSNLMMFSSVVAGLFLTVFLGIVSGLYPSMRASRLDAVTSMRFE
jgi:putative ABC transport system permease protein